jgi:signal transduction histidine kinase/ligand-binding sensor domain-containing protein
VGNRQTVRRRAAALGALLVGLPLIRCPRAWALDAALDVSQYAHTAWRVRDGFTKGQITAIAQTPDGYLWLGTQFGLYRFDGVRAVPWQPPAGEELASTFITRLLVTRDGTLWIGTLKGLVSWENGKLTTYPDLGGHTVASLLEDHEGAVWAGEWGLESPEELCSIRSASVQCYGRDGSLGAGALSLYEDKSGNLWVSGGMIGRLGIWRWKPGPPKFYANQGRSKDGIHSFIEDTDGSLLIAGRGITRFGEGRAEARPYSLPPFARGLIVDQLLRDHDGGLWIATYGGGILHVHKGRTDEFSESDGLSGNTLNAVFEDREGNVWVATSKGLDRFRSFAIPAWSSAQGLRIGAGSAVMAARDGEVWAGVQDGLAEMSQGQITAYRRHAQPISTGDQSTRTEPVREVVDPQIPENGFGALFEDQSGRIWESSRTGVGYLENHRFHIIGPLGTQVVLSMAEDTRGDLWASAQGSGLFRLSSDGEVEKLPWAKLGHEDFATVLAGDPLRGGLWAGFFNGGVVYVKEGQVRASYTVADGLGEGRVADIRISRDGTVWVSTPGGLSWVHNGHIATLSSKNGLLCNRVWWSVEDDEHFVWLYMPCGLVRIARSELDAGLSDAKRVVKLTVFDESDGVRTLADFTGATPQASKAPDGRIWFSAVDGVSVIDPRHLPYNKVPPPVQIEQIIVDRKNYYESASVVTADVNRRVRLPALSRDLQIDYTALSLVAPEKVQFRYKLEGFDKDWQDAGTRRQAFFSNLPPRKYRFWVMACNNSGVWNEAGTFLDFSIAPAYYQTIWFRLSCVAALLALLWAVYQLRLRQVAQQFNMRLEERVGERTRIARELHDTLLQSFHGLLLRFQAATNLLPERPEEAKQGFESAIDQAAQAITEGRDAVQGLRSSTVETNDLALAIGALSEELGCGETNPNCAEFDVEVEGTPRNLHPILRDEVYRIAGEAVRNAFKHAEAERVGVEICYDERQLRVRVRDDGKGIDAKDLNEDGRTGHFGLRGMRERAKIIGGNLEVWSSPQSGTEVELTIPARAAYATASHPRSWFSRKAARGSPGREPSRSHE